MALVTTRLFGRFGNQLLQIANVIAYSNKYGVPYCIPKDTANNSVWKPYHFENINYCEPHIRNKRTCIYTEPSHAYTEIPKIDCDGVTLLNGYFQSLKYFEDYLPEVRKAFGFDYTVKRPEAVALHKRLGDYKLYPTRHCIISDEYIKQSLGILKEKGYSTCIVFSDEIEECVKTINSDIYPDWEFEYSYNHTELQDFQLMLECGSFILSASTYGLMASILSESENKTSIAPEKWFEFENNHLDASTICPEKYIRL